MDWDDAEEIAAALYREFPDVEPLSLKFSELRDLVVDLDDFEGNARGANEVRLEAIQMAWLDEIEAAH